MGLEENGPPLAARLLLRVLPDYAPVADIRNKRETLLFLMFLKENIRKEENIRHNEENVLCFLFTFLC